MKVELVRFYTPTATWGNLVVKGKPICLTLERPWIGNQVDISCIPEGVYPCERIISLKYGSVYHVKDVEGRTEILMHTSNLVEELKGCIAYGSTFSELYEKEAVLGSSDAKKRFYDSIDNADEFDLVVRGA